MDLREFVEESNLTFLKEIDPKIITKWDKRCNKYVQENKRMGEFRCNLCGKIFITSLDSAVSGHTKSCGCKGFVKNLMLPLAQDLVI